jgi:hypothetical protein
MDFESFITSNTHENGIIYLNGLYSIDTMMIEDPDTGEFIEVIQEINIPLSKNKDFKITSAKNHITAPFERSIYSSSGKFVRSALYEIEFEKKRRLCNYRNYSK